MQRIAHRVNDPAQLRATPRDLGVEVDVHAYGDRLVVHHDAFADGVDFERWLEAYDHALLVLDVKEEGVERRARELVLARGIEDFFMLNLHFPALVQMVAAGERRIAVRVSEFESPATALRLAGRADWVWLDLFTRFPLDREEYESLRDARFSLCLVSPELVGRDVGTIAGLRRQLDDGGFEVDAVCTKRPDLW